MYGMYIYCLAFHFLNIMSRRFFRIVHKKLSFDCFFGSCIVHCLYCGVLTVVYLLTDIGFPGLLL